MVWTYDPSFLILDRLSKESIIPANSLRVCSQHIMGNMYVYGLRHVQMEDGNVSVNAAAFVYHLTCAFVLGNLLFYTIWVTVIQYSTPRENTHCWNTRSMVLFPILFVCIPQCRHMIRCVLHWYLCTEVIVSALKNSLKENLVDRRVLCHKVNISKK